MTSSSAIQRVTHVPYMKLLPDEQYDALVERARLVLGCVPPGSVLSHVTAAQLHGIPLPESALLDPRTHVVRPLPATQARVAGVCGHRALHPRDVTTIRGLPVVGLADTFADLGELIGPGKPLGLDDAVVAGDACATMLGRVGPLRLAVEARVRPRGKRTLAEALRFVRVGAASPRETIARLMFVRAGLPEPSLNEPICSAVDPDRVLGFADLLSAVGPRFFASHVMDEAVQRSMAAEARRAAHETWDSRWGRWG